MNSSQISVVADGNIFKAIATAQKWLQTFNVECLQLQITPAGDSKFGWIIDINYRKPQRKTT